MRRQYGGGHPVMADPAPAITKLLPHDKPEKGAL